MPSYDIYVDQMSYARQDEIMSQNKTSVRSMQIVKDAQYEYSKTLRGGKINCKQAKVIIATALSIPV